MVGAYDRALPSTNYLKRRFERVEYIFYFDGSRGNF
jgi:hypothetical protein